MDVGLFAHPGEGNYLFRSDPVHDGLVESVGHLLLQLRQDGVELPQLLRRPAAFLTGSQMSLQLTFLLWGQFTVQLQAQKLQSAVAVAHGRSPPLLCFITF